MLFRDEYRKNIDGRMADGPMGANRPPTPPQKNFREPQIPFIILTIRMLAIHTVKIHCP